MQAFTSRDFLFGSLPRRSLSSALPPPPRYSRLPGLTKAPHTVLGQASLAAHLLNSLPFMHPPSFFLLATHQSLDSPAPLLALSDEMPPMYGATTQPFPCPPSPSTLAMRRSSQASPPSLIPPPPYCSSQPSPGSPDSLDDPHHLATPTQRSYFLDLSNLFEEGAEAYKESMSPSDKPAARRGGRTADKGRRGE